MYFNTKRATDLTLTNERVRSLLKTSGSLRMPLALCQSNTKTEEDIIGDMISEVGVWGVRWWSPWHADVARAARRRSETRSQLQMYYLSDGSGAHSGKRNWFLHNLTAKTPPWDLSVVLKTKHSFVFYYFPRNKCIFYVHIRTPYEMKASWWGLATSFQDRTAFIRRAFYYFFTTWNKECLILFDRPCLIFYSKEGFVNIIIKCALWI